MTPSPTSPRVRPTYCSATATARSGRPRTPGRREPRSRSVISTGTATWTWPPPPPRRPCRSSWGTATAPSRLPTPSRSTGPEASLSSVAVGDFNGDGLLDLGVTTNVYFHDGYDPYYGYPFGHFEGSAHVLVGDGSGAFSGPNTTPLGYGYLWKPAVGGLQRRQYRRPRHPQHGHLGGQRAPGRRRWLPPAPHRGLRFLPLIGGQCRSGWRPRRRPGDDEPVQLLRGQRLARGRGGRVRQPQDSTPPARAPCPPHWPTSTATASSTSSRRRTPGTPAPTRVTSTSCWVKATGRSHSPIYQYLDRRATATALTAADFDGDGLPDVALAS